MDPKWFFNGPRTWADHSRRFTVARAGRAGAPDGLIGPPSLAPQKQEVRPPRSGQARYLPHDRQAKRGAWIAAAQLNANQFIERLTPLGSPEDVKKAQRYLKPGLKDCGDVDVSIGARMGDVFALAKEFTDMPLDEVEVLLDSPVHEVRVGAVSIMDFQARNKRTPLKRRKELFDLYIRRHDRINTWDLVDRSAPYVVGGYLFDKPRDILYKLARSRDMCERRTAIVATYYFIRQDDTAETFKIAEVLVNDDNDLIHKAVGGWVREAGKRDPDGLLDFLDRFAATMPRTALRYAVEHLDKTQPDHYMGLKQA
jgi:3-methyladenine DNA glycosylase AlkD